MRHTASIIITTAVGGTLWFGAAAVRDASAEAGRPPQALHAPAKVAVVSDADRRAELNARLQAMLQDGKGARLADPKPQTTPAPRRQTAARRSPETPRPARAVAARATAPALEPTATIAPPAYDPSRARPTGGRGYTAPKLDLTSMPAVPTDPVECLTQAIYYEARNESEDGQAAVAEVVLNRANSGRYPGDVCAVVYQRNSRTCQFTFTCDGSIGRYPVNMTAWARAERIAREVYAGKPTTLLPRTSVNYHANYVRPSWSSRLERVRRIGAHIFYGAALNGSTPGANEAPAPRQRGLMFVKNDAFERAYAMLTGKPAEDAGS
ncbi:MAG: cell wall hydrolase [Brevundimonas sp.]|uniref:cell wall hydrolase n=1 Tax=Brevundimonas sp. TaxID=1871086 RepID=UPI00258FAAB6|nr:cell wall hydrolase [Brevundimonas sp.]MCV0414353.1 cell wall hydrolase [Brevundimonas sp.]